jgi:hypothetical protein
MEGNWAAENLQVIRTLMERSAVYRRALAPAMLVLGVLGLVAGLAGWLLSLDGGRVFVGYWMGVSLIGVACAYLMVRRQSLQAAEAFWSPPTRRVTQALLPQLFIGLAVGLFMIVPRVRDPLVLWWLPPLWMALYGGAMHAAGFFMQRGIKLFGWIFILCGCVMGLWLTFGGGVPPLDRAHFVMGGFFGGLHLAYGIYLYFTEKKNDEP